MSLVRRYSAVSVFGLGHGLGDFIAGLILADLGANRRADVVVCYFIYNVLAFLGQPLAGYLCDLVASSRILFSVSLGLSATSLLMLPSAPVVAVVLSGVASAFYHSSGGAVAWEIGERRALAAGLFAAPGVVGLAAGLAFFSYLRGHDHLIVAGFQFTVMLVSWHLCRQLALPEQEVARGPLRIRGILGGSAGWLILIAISARSFAWTIGQEAIFPPDSAVALAVAAAVGKCAAGLLGDRFDTRRVATVLLVLAAPLLLLGARWTIWLYPAVATLQAGTAPMMALVMRAWPKHPAFASGLAQGLAVAIGGAPLLFLHALGSLPLTLTGITLLVSAILLHVSGRGSLRVHS